MDSQGNVTAIPHHASSEQGKAGISDSQRESLEGVLEVLEACRTMLDKARG